MMKERDKGAREVRGWERHSKSRSFVAMLLRMTSLVDTSAYRLAYT
jgi:hypothetical protein